MPDQTRPGHILVPTSDQRIAELETLAERRRIRMQAAELDLVEARERIAELEAAQPETVGYVVAARREDGEFFGATIWTDPEQARAAEGVAAGYALDGESYDLYRVVRDA